MPRNLFEYHPITGYRFISGIKARVRHEGGGYFVHCNRLGFRCGHEVTKAKPKNTFRILLFGDSYTAGEGVSNRFRFGDLIERRNPSVQVLNFGLPGSGTDQQYLTFRHFALDLEYDLMLICPLVENIQRNMDSHRLTHSAFDGTLLLRPKPYFLLDNGELVLHHSPVPKASLSPNGPDGTGGQQVVEGSSVRHLMRRFTQKIDHVAPGFRSLTQRLRRIRLPHEYNDARHPAWLLMEAILGQWVRASHGPILICPIPTFGHIEGGILSDAYRRRFAELGRNHKVDIVDVLPHFLMKNRDVRLRCRFPNDDHPTPLGHAVIADALLPHVQKYVDSARLNGE